ncbi:unnamed protein product [Heligmosomoides polygyrus]|uniref:Uncharacterized protein n=1 Tax=Heligmosomoides polygyrus TaxID=6339 RepID=A0A183FZ71_HELPZ|nr:unnamed protein product [Heligmosomoides polygyrus]
MDGTEKGGGKRRGLARAITVEARMGMVTSGGKRRQNLQPHTLKKQDTSTQRRQHVWERGHTDQSAA